MEIINKYSKLEVADINTKIKWASYNVELGQRIACLGGAIYHPSNFFLNPDKSWNTLEKAQKELDNFYQEGYIKGHQVKPAYLDKHYTPDLETLQRGLFVAVFHKKEWHRGLIMRKHKRKDEYKIMMIDYGDHEYHPISKIRYIPLLFLEKLPAQAIQCKLNFDEELDAIHVRDIYWTGMESDIFFDIMKNYLMQVDFIKYELRSNFPSPIIWYVRMTKFKLNLETKMPEFIDEPVDKELVRLLGQSYRKQKRFVNKQEDAQVSPRTIASFPTETPADNKPLMEYEFLTCFPSQKRTNTWNAVNCHIEPLLSIASKIPSDAVNTSVRQFKGLTLAANVQ